MVKRVALALDREILDAIRKPPILPIEEAEKCWANATRLYRDSKKCSAPTKVALIELGLEETAKSGLILIRERIVNRLASDGSLLVSHRSDLPAEDELHQLLLENIGLFTAEAVGRAFRDHEVKLRFFEFSLAFIRRSTPLALSKEYRRTSSAPFGIRAIITLYSMKPMTQHFIQRLEKLVSTLKGLGITNLDELAKETGFYVNLANDGTHCKTPVSDPSLLKVLGQGASAAHIWTLGMLYSTRRRDSAFKSWSMRRYARWLVRRHGGSKTSQASLRSR